MNGRRYLAAVFALAFSALLIYVQTGLMLGYSLSMTAILNNSQADIWVSDAKLKSFESSGNIDSFYEYYLRMHPEVISVKPFLRSWCYALTDSSDMLWMPLFGIDPDKSCLMMPPEFIEEFGDSLQEPMTVVIDRSLAKNAGLDVGDYTEISKKRVKVVGITDGYKNDRSGFVFCSTLTFQGSEQPVPLGAVSAGESEISGQSGAGQRRAYKIFRAQAEDQGVDQGQSFLAVAEMAAFGIPEQSDFHIHIGFGNIYRGGDNQPVIALGHSGVAEGVRGAAGAGCVQARAVLSHS